MVHDSTRETVPQYRAFISYSHADAAFAGWLHRKLEAAKDADGQRLTPIFIDRAELAAGPDLTAQVRAALAGSAALIVISSPAARASHWVGQEIELFRELHPDSPIYAALIEGEPGEAFPQPLLVRDGQPVEPLAADFRKGQDGRRLGLLKILAGLTGQPLDRLVQRDAQSRQRRVMAVTAAALLLSLILAALLVVALRARSEAERQRAEAEGLVEFMLTDLRDRLKGVGSPTIMASVNDRALVYYSRQQLDSLPDESLDRRARVLHAMGEDSESLGKFEAAQGMYMEAWRITAEVLARHPNDPNAVFAHAQSEFWVGEAAWQRGDLSTTEKHWKGYLDQAMALETIEPREFRSFMELGFANGNMCELEFRKNADRKQALAFCKQATGYLRQAAALAPSDPKAKLALANRLGWQADVHVDLKQFADAKAAREEEAATLDALLKTEPENAQYQERRLWPMVGLGKILDSMGRRSDAIRLLKDCLSSYDGIAARSPDDSRLVAQQLRVSFLIADYLKRDRSPEAATYRAIARKHHSHLSRLLPAKQMGRFDAMISKLTVGE